jgi:ELWxxDGT repeat protein
MIIGCISNTAQAQQFHVVEVNKSKDANPNNNSLPWFPTSNSGTNGYDWGHTDTYYAILSGIAYFSADDGSHGAELWRSDGTEKGTYMIRDINPGAAASNINDITISGGKIFFSANNGNAQEVWITDGTADGTQPVTDLYAGGSTNPTYLTDVNGVLYFFTDNFYYGTQASQLWKTNGTSLGTELVTDFYFSGGFFYGSQGRQITNVNGHVFFSMYNYGYANELGFTDGTNAGTVILNSINPLGNGSNPSYLTPFNGLLYFSAFDGTGFHLWVSDGTMAGTHMINNPSSIYLDQNSTMRFPIINNSLYFTGYPIDNPAALCKFDASNANNNVELVKTITPGPGVNNMYNLSLVNNTIFFSVYNGKDQTLWKSDGTSEGTGEVIDINPGGRNIYLYKHFIDANGSLLFSFYDDQYGYELWKSDGSSKGTVMVKDINPGAYSAWVTNISYLGKNISLFEAFDGKNGFELWRTDGTEGGTWMVKNINRSKTASSDPVWLTPSPDKKSLIFAGYDPEYGHEMRITDGTDAGTRVIKDVYNGSFDSWPYLPANLKHNTYFFANIDNPIPQQDHGSDVHYVSRFWKTDGSPKGTSMIPVPALEDLINTHGYVENPPSAPVATDNLLYMVIFNTNTYLQELWRSDGTTKGTYAVKTDINTYYNISPTPVGKDLYFIDYNIWTYTLELWVTDGTVSGTHTLPLNGANYPQGLYEFKNKLYFTAYDPVNFYQSLWVTDGSASGASLVKSIYVAPWVPFAKTKEKFFFTGYDPNTTAGYELWTSDGSSQGTKMVKDIFTGDYNSSYPSQLTAVGSMIFFTSTDSASGYELWKSDGSLKGTQLVLDGTPGQGGSYGISNLVGADDQLYFLQNGALWSSCGTPKNTSLVDDAALTSVCCISNMTIVDNKLAFTGNSFAYGTEIWMGSVNCKTHDDHDELNMLKFADGEDGSSGIYPNPAHNELTVKVSSSVDSRVTLTVIDVNGATLITKTLGSGETNAQINIANLPPGVYFVKIISTNSRENKVKKFVKM